MTLIGGAAMTAIAAGFDRGTAAPRLGGASKTLYWMATVTPCDKIWQFDPAVMRAIMEWHNTADAETIVVLGITSEVPSFSLAKRKLVAETALKNKNGLNIIISPAMPHTAQTIDLTWHAEDVRGVLVIPPFHFNVCPAESLAVYYSMLLDAVQRSISLCHIPKTSEAPINIQSLKNLQYDPRLADVKNSSGDRGYTEFMKAFPKRNMRSGTIDNLEMVIENGVGTFSTGAMPSSASSAPRSPQYIVKTAIEEVAMDKLRDVQKSNDDDAGGTSYDATQEYVVSLEMGGSQINLARRTSNSPMGRNHSRVRRIPSGSTRSRSEARSISHWSKLARPKKGDSMARIGARHVVGILFASLMLKSSLAAAQVLSPSGQTVTLHRAAHADVVAYVQKFNAYPATWTALGNPSEALAAIHMDVGAPLKGLTVAVQGDTGTTAKVLSRANADSSAYPNPYQAISGFLKMPPGRNMGSTSGVAVDSKGHIWVAERCGANNCQDSPLDPIMEFDESGRFVKAFGAGMFVFPHGLYIDRHDNIWVTDPRAAGGKGAQVLQFDSSGKVLQRLGRAGVSAEGADTLLEPNAVIVASDGSIFVADGHTPNKPSRLVKFDAKGRFLKQWGGAGGCPGQFNVPHALAMDSKGRLFVGDRGNNRIQIYDEEGILLDSWTQFGRPSGLYIDDHDTLYVADSESRTPEGYGHHPGWRRGIRIGSAVDGRVTTFITDSTPDPDKNDGSGAEGIWADSDGVIYAAEVLQKAVTRYEKK
ncbi:dihydrodipicolinate synthase family protein [Bradyrhizobium monzae]|uniref:dihydrodipicolinate synthase family protein n=1 Tax=Bradyrhizobium sp. Oc8 TaxID=2876780 RepID=UPI001F1EDCC9|nr:dihydrodipicolinate synthase family protein [Bradyrhizobium sp. Oc8]